MKYIAKKANERFGQAFGNEPFNNSSSNREKEGNITIDNSRANTKTSNPNVGEYVDFEEVD